MQKPPIFQGDFNIQAGIIYCSECITRFLRFYRQIK